MCVFVLSIFFSRLVKYRLYNIINVVSELSFLVNLLSHLLKVILLESPKLYRKLGVELSLFYRRFIEETILDIETKREYEKFIENKLITFFAVKSQNSILFHVVKFRLSCVVYAEKFLSVWALTFRKVKNPEGLVYF